MNVASIVLTGLQAEVLLCTQLLKLLLTDESREARKASSASDAHCVKKKKKKRKKKKRKSHGFAAIGFEAIFLLRDAPQNEVYSTVAAVST